MDDVQRYMVVYEPGIGEYAIENESGRWVQHSDHTAKVRELEAAVEALTKCVIGGMIAKSGLRRCTKTSIGAGGQTIQECVDRERYHNVPLVIFEQFEEAVAAMYDNPIAREAVEKARNEAGLGSGA